RVLDAHAPGLDPTDAPGVVAQQENIAREAFDRKVLVHLSNEGAGWLLNDVVVGDVGYCAATGDGSQARAAPPAHHAMHAVPVQVSGTATAAGRDALAQHFQKRVECAPRQRSIRRGT